MYEHATYGVQLSLDMVVSVRCGWVDQSLSLQFAATYDVR